jgi:hypothetical protein
LNVMDHEPDYSNYKLDELLDAAAHVNRERYRERAQRIDEEIARRQKEDRTVVETASNGGQIAWTIKVMQMIYAWLAWLGSIATVFVLLGLSKKHPPIEALEGIMAVCAYSFAYYGLKRRKHWVIPLLFIMAAFMFIRSLLLILQPANDITSLLYKIFDSAYVFFAAYQIYMFRRTEVRRVFHANGEIIV